MLSQLPAFVLFAVLILVELWLLFRKPDVLSKLAFWPMGRFSLPRGVAKAAVEQALAGMPAVGEFEETDAGFSGYLRSQGLRLSYDRALFLLRFSIDAENRRIRFAGAALPIAYLPFLLTYTATAEGPNAFSTTLFLWGALLVTWLISLFVGRKMAKAFAKALESI